MAFGKRMGRLKVGQDQPLASHEPDASDKSRAAHLDFGLLFLPRFHPGNAQGRSRRPLLDHTYVGLPLLLEEDQIARPRIAEAIRKLIDNHMTPF